MSHHLHFLQSGCKLSISVFELLECCCHHEGFWLGSWRPGYSKSCLQIKVLDVACIKNNRLKNALLGQVSSYPFETAADKRLAPTV